MGQDRIGPGQAEKIEQVAFNTIAVKKDGAQVCQQEVVGEEKIVFSRTGHRHDPAVEIVAVGSHHRAGPLRCLQQPGVGHLQ